MSRYDILLNDPKKEAPAKEEQSAATSIKPTDRPNGLPTNRPPDEFSIRLADRATGGSRGELIRRGFEWYTDQLRALKKLSLQEQMEGRAGSMSAMVREALDDYLRKRASEK